jgi:CRISPR-associated endonuclease Cas1
LKTFSDMVEGDVRMIEIMAVWCRMGVVDRNGQWKNVESGVRQGQIIAPLIANLYLHPLDELANDKRWGWIRYADNFLIQLSEEEQINHAILEVDEFVKQSLKLRLNKEESPVRHLDQGFSFLGVCFKGATKSIDVKKINKMNRRIAWVLSEKNRSDPQIILQQLHEIIEGWRQYYGFLSPDEQFTELDRQIEDALSSLIRNRIATSSWPVTPPENLELPSLMEHPGDNRRKRLALIWGKSRPVDLSGIKKTADKKISQKRQHYKRAEVQGGELVVTSPGLFVGIREGRIVVREKQTVVAEMPSMQLRGITLAGKGVSLSSDVVCFCASQDVHIHFIDGLGKIIAVAYPPSGSAAEVSICQIRHAEDAVGQQIARTIVYGKVKNQLALLKYFGKYQNSKNGQFREVFVEKETEFNALIKKIRQMKHTDDSSFKQQLMGLEGASAAIYWKLVAILLPSSVGFAGRKREGATDLVNSLLNYGYGILYSRILNIVIRVGLNPVCSFLHSYQSNKPTLIYDMVEEFRSFAVDRAVFTLLNRRERLELNTEHRLTDETRKKLTRAVLNKIGSETVFRGKKQTIERIMQHQVDHLKQVLIKGGQYRPFLARW